MTYLRPFLSFFLCFMVFNVYSQFELDSLKQKWSNLGRESIEGVYTLSGSSRSYSIALAKENDIYKLVYLDGDLQSWLYGDLKGMIAPSEEKMYEGRWNAGLPTEPNLEDIKVVFGDKKFILYWSDWSIDEFKMVYPEKAKESTDMDKIFMTEAFKRETIIIPIQNNDSSLIEIPVLLNDVLKIYVGIEKMTTSVVMSKDIAKTLIQTKTLGYQEWNEGNYYEFIDENKAFKKPHTFTLNSMKIGEEELLNLDVEISDNLSRSVIISFDLLEKIGTVNIDLDKMFLSIKPKK